MRVLALGNLKIQGESLSGGTSLNRVRQLGILIVLSSLSHCKFFTLLLGKI